MLRVIFAVMICCLPLVGLAQPAGSDAEPSQVESLGKAVSFFAPFFLPKLANDIYRLREYIMSEEFAALRGERGDLASVDALFERAMDLSWNNVYAALFVSFAATMEHRNFGVRFPVVGPLLWVPLTSEFPGEFRARVSALPSRIYPDSPSDHAGDRDKLQHFFGSAFIAYTFESGDAAERVGNFVEWGEDQFIVEGALDDRDIRANMQGQQFGLSLLRDSSIRPSQYLLFVLVAQPSIQPIDSVSEPCGMEVR